ncbi:hypothetical protein MYA_2822 [Burkholderia sp. KJ006]|nr:hypothetical protein MYA_2822 [Burkholderia sp. KJ006]
MRLSGPERDSDRPKRAGFPPYFLGFGAGRAAILFRDPAWCAWCGAGGSPGTSGSLLLCLGTAWLPTSAESGRYCNKCRRWPRRRTVAWPARRRRSPARARPRRGPSRAR